MKIIAVFAASALAAGTITAAARRMRNAMDGMAIVAVAGMMEAGIAAIAGTVRVTAMAGAAGIAAIAAAMAGGVAMDGRASCVASTRAITVRSAGASVADRGNRSGIATLLKRAGQARQESIA